MTGNKDNRRISEMRNLGPACEQDLNAVGIMTADDVKRLGPEGTFIRMLRGRVQLGRATLSCNAIYLYAIHGAIHEMDWRDLPVKTKEKYKSFTAQLRESGQFAGSSKQR